MWLGQTAQHQVAPDLVDQLGKGDSLRGQVSLERSNVQAQALRRLLDRRLAERKLHIQDLAHCLRESVFPRLAGVAIGAGFEAPSVQPVQLRARLPGRLGADTRNLHAQRPAVEHDGHALGLHVRCGIEDDIWNQRQTAKMTTVEQIEQLVRIAREFGREVANGKEARQIYKIGTFYENADESLAKNGLAPNRKPRQAGFVDSQ